MEKGKDFVKSAESADVIEDSPTKAKLKCPALNDGFYGADSKKMKYTGGAKQWTNLASALQDATQRVTTDVSEGHGDF